MKITTVAIFLLLANICFGQSFTVTPAGLKDNADTTKPYLVIKVENKTTDDLYNNALLFVKKLYPSTYQELTDDGAQQKFIRFTNGPVTFCTTKRAWVKIPVDCQFTIELRFKDGRTKLDITELTMNNHDDSKFPWFISGTGRNSFYIYDASTGELLKADVKSSLESLINKIPTALIPFLNGTVKESQKNDNW